MQENNPTTKLCFKCKEVKPLTEFYRHLQMADKHLNKCKECTRADVEKNRAAKAEYYKKYDRDRFQNNPKRRAEQLEAMKRNYDPAKQLEYKRAYRARNKDKYKAHYAVSNALQDGRLVRNPTCEKCGANSEHAHHDDYTKPLEVRWFCRPCHLAQHRELNEAKRQES